MATAKEIANSLLRPVEKKEKPEKEMVGPEEAPKKEITTRSGKIASALLGSEAYTKDSISRYNDTSKSFYDSINALYSDVNKGVYKSKEELTKYFDSYKDLVNDTERAVEYFKDKDENTYKGLESKLTNLYKLKDDLGSISSYYGRFKDENGYRIAMLYNVPQGSESTVADSIRDIAFTKNRAGVVEVLINPLTLLKDSSVITEDGMTAMGTLLAKEGYDVKELLSGVKSSNDNLILNTADKVGIMPDNYKDSNAIVRNVLEKYGFTDGEITAYLSAVAYDNGQAETDRQFTAIYQKIEDTIHSKWWTDAILSAVSVPMSVLGGVDAAADLIKQNIASAIDNTFVIDYHNGAQMLSGASTKIRGKTEGDLSDKFGEGAGFGYQIGMSIADSVLAMVASAGIGAAISGASAASGTMSFAQAAQNAPWVSGVLLGSSAGATTTQSFKAMGYTDSEAFAMGVLAGTAESVFETWSLEKLLGDTINKISKASLTEVGVKRLLKQTGAILGQALCEGSEELATEVANAMSEVFVLGVGNTTMDAAMQTYMEQGMSYHDAHWKALLDKSVDVLLAFVGGAISGGVMGGGAFTMNSAHQMALKLQYHRDYLKGVTALEKVLDNNVAMSKLRTKLATSFQTTGDKLIDSHINAIVKAGNDENILRTEYAKVGAEPEVREAALAISIAAQKDTKNNETLAADISSVLGVTVTAEDLATNRGGIATIYASYLYFDGLTVSGKKAVIDRAIARTEKFLDEQIKKNKDSVQGRIYYGEVDKSKFDALRKHSVRAIENLANVLDVNVVFFDSSVKGNMKVNGFLDRSTNTVYLDINSGNNAEGVMLFTMAHELVHFMKQESANSYKVLEQFLIDTYGKDKMNTLINEQIAKAKKYGDNMSPEAALEEVICDFAARMLADKKVLTDFARLSNKHKGLAEKIKSFFADSETKLEEMYSKFEADTPEAYELSQLGKGSLNAFRDVFEKSLLDTAVAYRSKKKDGKIGTIDLNAYKEARDEKGDLVFRYQDHKFSRKLREISTVTEEEYKTMESHFGTTGNFKVAGYLLPDGKLLDFSGKHWGDTTSRTRQVDHRDIGEVLDRGNNGVADMIDMIGSGSIRLMPEVGGINLATYPNEKQRKVLSLYIRQMLATEGQVIIDFDEVGGDTVHSRIYEKNATSSRILGDIRNYFNGARQSDLMAFHTSDSDYVYSRKSVDNNAQGEYNANNNVEGDATNGREEASRKIGSQEVVRNDTAGKGSNREEITRKIKEILRKSSVKRNDNSVDERGTARVEQKETAEAFEERVRNDGYQYVPYGKTAVAFKTAPKSEWNENARVAAEHLENLGVTVIVLDGDLLSNHEDVTQINSEGAAFGKGDFTTVFLSSNLSVDGKETAYHEAFHALKRMNIGGEYRKKIIDTIAKGVNVESEAFNKFISYISDLYAYEVKDVSFDNFAAEVTEEFYAWYIGGVYATKNEHSADIRSYIEDFSSATDVTAQLDAVFAEIANKNNEDIRYSRKATPEDARAAIERVKSGEVVEAPKVKEYEAMTRGQLKKFIADFSKNKSYSNEVAKSVVAAFKDVKYLKPEEIESITDIIWQGLNDFDKIEDRKQFAHEMAEFYATKIIEAQNAMFDDSSDTDTAENYEKYIADIINSVENEILNSYFTKGRQATRSALKDALDVQKERVITTRLLVKLNNKFHYMSRANKADFIYTDLVKQIQSFKLDFGRELTVQEVKPFAERLAAFLQKLSQPSNTEIDVGGKGETKINADAFDPDKSIIDAEALDVISELAGMDDSSERELTVDEYKMFNNVLGLVTKLVSVYGNEYVDGKWQNNIDNVNAVIDSSTKAYDSNKHIENVTKTPLLRTLKEQYDTPTDYINYIFGARESNLINRYVNDIVRAADDMRAEYIRILKPFEDFIKDEKYTKRLYKDEVTICGEKITIGEFISLYCTSKREHAHSGLVEKETEFGNANEKSTSKLPGKKIRKILLGNNVKKVLDNINKVYETLTDKDKAFIKLVENFFNSTSTTIKADADLKYWGYTNAYDEGYYFPISRIWGGHDVASVYVGAISVVKQSFNHRINKKATAALHIDNVYDVITKHLDGLMQYKHMFVPVQNFSKLFGKNISKKAGGSYTVLTMLKERTGGTSVKYVRDWLANLQGKKTSGAKDIGPFKSVLATTSLGLNFQSVAKQNASLWAMSVEAPIQVGVAQLEGILPHVINEDKMTQYSSVAAYRKHDNAPYSAAIGKVSDDLKPRSGLATIGSEISDKTTSFLRWGDLKVAKAMWSACQRIVQKKQKLKIGTEENLVAAGKLLDEMINKYNDTTSVALKPLAVRDGGWYSMFAMFASQPIKMWSALTRYSSEMQTAKLLNDEEALKVARRKFFKTASSVALNAVWMALIEAIVRDLNRKGVPKDEDEVILHVIGASYVTELIGIVPIVGDIINAGLETLAGIATYDIGGDAMSDYLNSVVDLVKLGVQTAQKKGDIVEGRYKKVFELIAALCGVPARNAYKYATILSGQFDQLIKKTSTYVVDYYYSGYAPTVKDLKNAAKKDSRYAETMLEILASKRMGKKDADSDLTSYTIEELLRLYKAELGKGESGDLNFLLPSSVPSKYTSAETKKYYTVMDKAYGFANNLLGSAKYRTLDDEQRTDAISSVWSIYNDAAKVNATQSAASVPQAARYMIVTSGGEKSTEIYVLTNAYEKAYNNATKQERAKMKPISTYFAQLCKEYGVSNEQRVILAAALGIGSTDDIKNAVKKKAESKGITITTSKDE